MNFSAEEIRFAEPVTSTEAALSNLEKRRLKIRITFRCDFHSRIAGIIRKIFVMIPLIKTLH